MKDKDIEICGHDSHFWESKNLTRRGGGSAYWQIASVIEIVRRAVTIVALLCI